VGLRVGGDEGEGGGLAIVPDGEAILTLGVVVNFEAPAFGFVVVVEVEVEDLTAAEVVGFVPVLGLAAATLTSSSVLDCLLLDAKSSGRDKPAALITSRSRLFSSSSLVMVNWNQ